MTDPYMTRPTPAQPAPRRVLVLGGTGSIGRATVAALLRRGHEVVCIVRPTAPGTALPRPLPAGAILRPANVTDPESLDRDGFRGERFDALVSCLASRTGAPADAWDIDHRAHATALRLAQQAGVDRKSVV